MLDLFTFCIIESGGNIFAENNGVVYLFDPIAITWKNISNGLPPAYVWSMATYGQFLYAASAVGVYFTTNNGASWTPDTAGFRETALSLTTSGDHLFAGGDGGGIFGSDNNGTWNSFNTGLTNGYSLSLATFGDYLFTGTWGAGVWRRPLSEISGVINPNSKDRRINQISLKIDSSRRSNSNISIDITLNHSDRVTVKIYSLSGREIATLVNSSLGAGEHSLLWDTKGMAAGCYVAKMKVGSSVIVKNILFSM